METATAVNPPQLREVRGPSAFGGDPARFWELLWTISQSEFRLTYANTRLGFLWTLLKPLAFFGVIFVVLRGILRFGAGIEDFPLLLILGLILFQFFQEVTSRCLRAVPQREAMVRKLEFPRVIIPLSVTLTAGMTLVLNLIAVLPLFLALGCYPKLGWLLLLPIALVLAAFAMALGMILAVLFLRHEDTGQVWTLISRMLFYASAVLFPLAVVPAPWNEIVAVNPLATIIETARAVVIAPDLDGPVAVAGPLTGLIVPSLLILVTIPLALRMFTKAAPLAAETL
jgi:ABC-2 type transport system permease protein